MPDDQDNYTASVAVPTKDDKERRNGDGESVQRGLEAKNEHEANRPSLLRALRSDATGKPTMPWHAMLASSLPFNLPFSIHSSPTINIR